MTSTSTILAEVVALGAQVRVADGRLVLKAGAVPVPADLLRRLRESKAALLELLSEERRAPFLHPCEVCGEWGAFGYGVILRAGKLGSWFCFAHRPAAPTRSGLSGIEGGS
jgi:hypothetical protein